VTESLPDCLVRWLRGSKVRNTTTAVILTLVALGAALQVQCSHYVSVPTRPVYYIHQDLQSRVGWVTDEARRITWQSFYDTWGQPLPGYPQSLPDTNGRKITMPLRGPGQRWAGKREVLGQTVYDNGQRQYEPSLGRFATPEPLMLGSPIHPFGGTVNPYTAVYHNPVSVQDADGLAGSCGPGGTYCAAIFASVYNGARGVTNAAMGAGSRLAQQVMNSPAAQGMQRNWNRMQAYCAQRWNQAGQTLQQSWNALRSSGGTPKLVSRGASGIPDASRLSPSEQATAGRLMERLGVVLRESTHVGAEYIDELGRTYDALGNPAASRFWNNGEFFRSIQRHLQKSNNFTVIDLTGFTYNQVAEVSSYLSTLGPSALSRIIKVGF
jgi:RHS repeat-associated protein